MPLALALSPKVTTLLLLAQAQKQLEAPHQPSPQAKI